MDVLHLNSQIAKLEAAAHINDKVVLLKQIAEMFKRDKTPPYLAMIKTSNFIKILAEAMEVNKQQWLKKQSWIYNTLLTIYSIMKLDIPLPQTKLIIEVAVDYMISTEDELPPAILFAIAGRIDAPISQVLFDNHLLHKRMKELALLASSASKALCFYAQVTAFDNWKMRLLEDEQFLKNLVGKPIPDTWVLFSQLSKHSKAKQYIPQVVIQKASLVDDEWCPAICATLCDPSNAGDLKMNVKFIESSAKHLEELLDNQGSTAFYRHSLFGLLFPLANLSVGDANKETLGKLFIPLLKRALQVPNNCANTMINNLKLGEAKQLAAKILLNLGTTEANHKRITDGDGMAALKQVRNTETDPTLKRDLEAVLAAKLKRAPSATVSSTPPAPKIRGPRRQPPASTRTQETDGLDYVSDKSSLKLEKPRFSCRVHMLQDFPKVLVGIKDLDDVIDECLDVSKEKLRLLPASVTRLSEDEALAVVAYSFDAQESDPSHNLYYVLNKALREHDAEKLKKFGPYLTFLLSAISKLPEMTTTVYRGVPRTAAKMIEEKYEMGAVIHWSAFTSTTTNIENAKSFARSKGFGGVILRIRVITGRNIQPYSYIESEEEVLLSPNCTLQVIQPLHKGEDGLNYVELAESKKGKMFIF